jgi:uncharacterized protein (UPF0333 family)
MAARQLVWSFELGCSKLVQRNTANRGKMLFSVRNNIHRVDIKEIDTFNVIKTVSIVYTQFA